MPDQRNLILVGPMGAGKSAVGRQLAQHLSRDFYDSDHAIVERTGVDISYIFEKEGEEGFRKRETCIIGELVNKDNIVLSTGGGSVVKAKNRELIAKSGTVIYLHASVEQQATRTKKTDNRPLLKAENPRSILERLMEEREPHYRDVSELVIRTDGQRVGDVVKHILKKLDKLSSNEEHNAQNLTELNVRTINRKYSVHVGNQSLRNIVGSEDFISRPSIVLTDENLDMLYREKLEPIIKPKAWLVVPASETSKSFKHYQWLLEQLLELGVKRDTQLVAIGGGVVGDLAGFVAATYMRGMHLIHVPTSLLAMVDSSIGGKTGINLAQGKNLVGSIYQPYGVISDLSFLKTLPEKEFITGLAEVVKYALINDPEFLSYLEENSAAIQERDLTVMHKIVTHCAKAKADIVEQDEQDLGTRMLLNLGHTFGHAIEKLQQYQGFTHGQAVSVGMCMAADVSEKIGHITLVDVKRLKNLLKSLHLPTSWSDFEVDEFMQAMQVDKKNTADKRRFILLKSLGEAYINEDVDTDTLESVLRSYSNKA